MYLKSNVLTRSYPWRWKSSNWRSKILDVLDASTEKTLTLVIVCRSLGGITESDLAEAEKINATRISIPLLTSDGECLESTLRIHQTAWKICLSSR